MSTDQDRATDTPPTRECWSAGPAPDLRHGRGRRGPRRRRCPRRAHHDHRPQRLREVDAAQGPGPDDAAARGTVLLDGADIHSLPTKAVARRLGLLPAELHRARGDHRRRPGLTRPLPLPAAAAPVVARRRAIGQRGHGGDRRDAVRPALGGRALRRRAPARLAGMVLAQQTSTLLLDEPTTFLDLAHQIDVLELFASVKRHGR